MPELPEVETIVRQLQRTVVGRTIERVEVLDKMVDSRLKRITPIKIRGVERRAKYIIIRLGKQKSILVHLAMPGHFRFFPKGKKIGPEERKFVVAKFYLDDGSLLTHNSIRKFGMVKLINQKQLEQKLGKLGPEPLSPELTLDVFKKVLSKKKKANLKVTLLDQNFIAGMGNIYAQEILYHARIDPRRKIENLSEMEVKKLYLQMKKVLQSAVVHQGTTIDNYSHMTGIGAYQKFLTVYQLDKCPKHHALKRINQGGRGTFYCPVCQK